MVITQERHLYGYNLAVYSAEFPYKSDRILVEASQGFSKFENAYIPFKNFMKEDVFLRKLNSLTYDTFTKDDPEGKLIIQTIDELPTIENCNIKIYCVDNNFYDEIDQPKEYLCIIKNIDNNTYFIWRYDTFIRSGLNPQTIALNIPMTVTITDGWPALKGRCDFTFGVDEYYTKLYIFDSKHPFDNFSNMSLKCLKAFDEAELLTNVQSSQQAGIFQNVFYIKPVYQGFELDLRNTVRSKLLDRSGNILNAVADQNQMNP